MHARVTAVRNLSPPRPSNTRRSGVRSSRGQSSSTAAKTVSGTDTHLALLVFDTAADIHHRWRVPTISGIRVDTRRAEALYNHRAGFEPPAATEDDGSDEP